MFGRRKKNETVAVTTTKAPVKAKSIKTGSTTIIVDCIEIKGDIKGCDAIHIDGTIHGDIDVEQSVVIGEKGSVYGNVKSKKVVVSGLLEGSIVCENLEVTIKGRISDNIKAKTIISDGNIEANVYSEESILIQGNGKTISEKIHSKTIVVDGSVKGNLVATQLLEIHKNGIVEGSMSVKNIKTQEGGRMLGSMATYMEVKATKTEKVKTEKTETEIEKVEEEDSFFNKD